ncbi:hypothetical protein GCM10009038_08910 [Salinicola rhizosphaerae]|uniref:TIGR02808 family protein n=1 Tax=Salinicola rhizosphaerae TaxID=1443141 RepID=A0ABQ3DSN9_9GAMM|nr:hypothetical protein GCM10009038_08910 [Salinicola rhizosphaerae]
MEIIQTIAVSILYALLTILPYLAVTVVLTVVACLVNELINKAKAKKNIAP